MKNLSYLALIPVIGLTLGSPVFVAPTYAATTQSQVIENNIYKHIVTLRIGSRSEQVRSLQKCMNQLGYSTGIADGIYGPNTARGLKSFQASKGLVADGIIGPKTGPVFEAVCAAAFGGNNSTVSNSQTGANVVENKEAKIKTTEFTERGDVKNNTKNQELGTFTIELDKKSGLVDIERVDVIMQVIDAAGSEKDLWDIFETVTLVHGGKELVVKNTGSKSSWSRVGSSDVYKARLDKFSSVIEPGEEAGFTLFVNTDKIKDSNLDISIKSSLEVRYKDMLGRSTLLGDEDFGSITFDITGTVDGDVNLTLSDKNPDVMIIFGDASTKKLSQSVLEFDIEAQYNDVELEEVVARVVATGIKTGARDMVKKAYLYSGSKLIDSGTLSTGGEIKFDMDSFKISEGDVEIFVVKLDLNNIDGVNVVDGATLSVEIVSVEGSDIQGEDFLKTISLIGNTHTYSIDTPLFAVQKVEFDTVSVSNNPDYATAKFEFEVTAGNKKDVYLSANESDWNVVVTGGTKGAFIIESKNNIDSGSGFKVKKGTTEKFTLSQVVTGTNSYAKVTLNSVLWDIDDASSVFEKTLSTGLIDFKTVSKYITS